jgi:hypothetical protein
MSSIFSIFLYHIQPECHDKTTYSDEYCFLSHRYFSTFFPGGGFFLKTPSSALHGKEV